MSSECLSPRYLWVLIPSHLHHDELRVHLTRKSMSSECPHLQVDEFGVRLSHAGGAGLSSVQRAHQVQHRQGKLGQGVVGQVGAENQQAAQRGCLRDGESCRGGRRTSAGAQGMGLRSRSQGEGSGPW